MALDLSIKKRVGNCWTEGTGETSRFQEKKEMQEKEKGAFLPCNGMRRKQQSYKILGKLELVASATKEVNWRLSDKG